MDAAINSTAVGNLFVSNRSCDTKTYTDFIQAAANKGVNPSVPLEGSEHKLSETSYIKFFNTNGGSDNNESSLVTLFVNGNDKIVFMGDAEQETEREIASQIPDVDLIKIGHHGSKASTTQSFLDKVSPEYAVILTGKGNKYGHPNYVVLDRLQAKSIDIHRTDECGDIVFSSKDNGVTTTCGKASFTPGSSSSSSSSSNSNDNTTPSSSKGTTSTNNGQAVVITTTGKKYHKSTCRTIKQIKSEVTPEEAKTQGYEPCGICKP